MRYPSYIRELDPNDFPGGMIYDPYEEEIDTPFEFLKQGDEVKCTKRDSIIYGTIEELTDCEVLVNNRWLHKDDYLFFVI